MSLFIVRSGDVYVTVEPTLDKEAVRAEREFCVTFAWTHAKGEAVRFPNRWHAKATARALAKAGKLASVVEVQS